MRQLLKGLLTIGSIMLAITIGTTHAFANKRHHHTGTTKVTHNTAHHTRHKHASRHHRLVRRSSPSVVPVEEAGIVPLPEPGLPPENNFSYLVASNAYAETLPGKKPADLAKEALACFPEGSTRAEIALVSDMLGLDVGLMNAFAKIESDFNPHERTGSYIGLFQLSRDEFNRYGPTDGNILNARDNTIAMAIKVEYEAAIFKMNTRHVPTNSDLYLIHQQGIQGAAQHLAEPERPAWESMCATDEGKEKGKGWCKKAIWGNTLPAFKSMVKSVENFTSGAFVQMWATRVATFLGQRPRLITVAVAADMPRTPKKSVEKDEHKHKAKEHSHETKEARLRHVHHGHKVVHHHLHHYAKA